VDTGNILFICGGAFHGLESIIERRLNRSDLGFGAAIEDRVEPESASVFRHCRPQDLVHYGLIPELVGRLPVIVSLDDLDEGDLVKVLTEPKNALVKQFEYIFRLEGLDLVFEPGALEAVGREAKKSKSGARGLRTILERILLEPMYSLPSKKLQPGSLLVSPDCVEGDAEVRYVPSEEVEEGVG